MNIETQILSEVTTHLKYSKYVPEKNRRETWDELVTRNKNMHIKKFPQLTNEIEGAYKYVYDKKILPSMRSMQFAGKPIEINNSRIFNCSYLPIDDFRAFSEIMFLLLSGCGVGYSVQTHHVEKLPEIRKPLKSKRYLVGDSIEGWADAIRMLTKAYFGQTSTAPLFDFRDIRAKGASLITVGGKAPGPEPLKIALIHMQAILDRKKDGEKLTSLECHDIICHLADAVLSGGIRRAALISLFNLHDEEMLTCKFGNWWEQNPQRGRANNSAVLLRQMIDKETFLNLWRKIEASNSGEPGFIFTNDKDSGTNPSLRAGTKVLTTNGIFNIEDLQDKEFEVKNLNGKISKAKCWLSGKDKQLYELTLKGGHKYYATPEHEWPVWDGEKYIKIKTPNLKSKDLLPIIKENSLFNGILGTKEEGFTIGWCTGDGNLSTSNQGRKQIGFVFSKEDVELGISGKVINILNKVGETNINGHHHKAGTLEIQTTNSKIISWIESFGFKHKSEGISSKIWNECSEDFRQGFIDGLFSSDGYISNINNKESRIILNSAHIKLINEVSELLGFYGIKTSILHKLVEGNFPDKKYNIKGKLYHNYSLKITDKESLKHFNNLFTLSHSRKQNNLINIINNKIKNNKINKYSDKIEVINCKLVDIKEDVWDITVYDETHCFQIAHCITGNCAEINLKSNQFCLTKDSLVLTDNGYQSIEELLEKKELPKIISTYIDDTKTVEDESSFSQHNFKIFPTGIKPVFELKTHRGPTVKTTGNHEFLTQDGYVALKDLDIDYHNLYMPQDNTFNKYNYIEREGFNEYDFLGWLIGDGCFTNNPNNLKNIYETLSIIFGSKEDIFAKIVLVPIMEALLQEAIDAGVTRDKEFKLKPYKDKNGVVSYVTSSTKARYIANKFGLKPGTAKDKVLPELYWSLSMENKARILSALFSADGSVTDTKHRKIIQLSLSNPILAQQIQLALSEFGISSKYTISERKNSKRCKTEIVFQIGNKTNIEIFKNNIGFTLHPRKQQDLDNITYNVIHHFKNHNKFSIENIKYVGDEEVFDITVEDSHNFIVNGLITHNCNLCEINASDIEIQEEYNNRAKAASFIGTLQASYTDFHYLRDVWKKTTEKEALLGIGMTGIASGAVLKLNMKEAAKVACEENERVAKIIGINKAARVTTVKPSGTTSLVLGTSSGIHAWHDDFYMRRIRLGKNEALYTYLSIHHPEMLEDDFFKPTLQSIVSIPQRAPLNSITRSESAMDMLERIKTINKNWIKPGHRKGANMHNVSATVTIKQDEWPAVGEWLYENKEYFTALSFLPEDLGSYKQPPFETITEEQFNEAVKSLHLVDLSKVIEMDDMTALMESVACSSGACEII